MKKYFKNPYIMKKSPFAKVEGNSANPLPDVQTIDVDNLIEFDKNNMKGGSLPGMFAIPMGIINRFSDAKKDFNKRQIQQKKIKFGDFKQNIQNYKNNANFSVFNYKK